MSNGTGPQTLQDWTRYLHTAAQVKPSDPDYAEAREAITHALLHINALHVGAGQREATEAEQVGAVPATLAALAHGASLGTGEVISGLGSAATGGTFREGAQQYREGLENVEASQPTLAATGELVGSAVLPAARGGQLLARGVKAGVPLGVAGGARLIGQGALTAGVPGAVAGFSAGGADPGDFEARIVQGAKTGALAAATGAAATGLALPAIRAHVERAADLESRGVMRDLRAQRLRNAIAAGLRREGPPEPVTEAPGMGGARAVVESGASPQAQQAVTDIAAAERDLAAGKISREDYETAVRYARGEPLPIPGSYGGQTAEGPPTPAAPTAPTAAEMVTARRAPVPAGPVQLPGGGQVVPAATGTVPAARAAPATPGPPQLAPWRRPVAPLSLEELRTPAGPTSLSELGTGETLPYYPRGGQEAQAIPPAVTTESSLGGPSRSVQQISDEMEQQIELAARLGQEPNLKNLPSLLARRGLTPQQIQAVGKELLRRSRRAS